MNSAIIETRAENQTQDKSIDDNRKKTIEGLVKEYAKDKKGSLIGQGYKLEAYYLYTHANGTPWYFRIRLNHPITGEKWIRPFHYNKAEEKWLPGEPKEFSQGKKPIYHLDKIVKSASDEIFFVEGENKVEALEKYGFTATTSGACETIEKADLTPLQGNKIVIWPDNDSPGRKWERDLIPILQLLGCDDISIIDVSKLGLPEKGDVVDYIKILKDKGCSAEDIKKKLLSIAAV